MQESFSTAAPFRIIVDDGGTRYKYAKVDLLDNSSGLLIYDYGSNTKLSRHADGKIWDRTAGSGQHIPPTTSVPFSDITQEDVRQVGIPSDATQTLPLLPGNPSPNDFVFSSTVMQSNGTFAAQIVDPGNLNTVRTQWENHPAYVSAQTCRAAGNKVVVLTILNDGSTGG